MVTRLNPYLSFRDNAREAMEFYRSVLGGTLIVSTFAEYHASEDPSEADKVMHAMLETEEGLVLMASDTPNSMEFNRGSAVSLSLSGDDASRLHALWDGLADGATVEMPLGPSPWGDSFGMLTDRFGTAWMVNIA
ncbi:MAG: VOC family protein [Actinobacteria bacterium]|nr:VOC family protein [Actinomycetota bacterium]